MEIKTGTIRQRVVIDAAPAEVYDAFMDARTHSGFTGSKAITDIATITCTRLAYALP